MEEISEIKFPIYRMVLLFHVLLGPSPKPLHSAGWPKQLILTVVISDIKEK